jgi:hypothetical protein
VCPTYLHLMHHIPKGCILDSCGNGLRLRFWFFIRQGICSFMACQTFMISPLNLSLISFNYDRNSSNRISINGGLVTLDFDGGIIARGIGVKIV